MQIHNGEITIIGSWRNAATGEQKDRLYATSFHGGDSVEFKTKGAAEFFLWLIDERVRGAKARE